MERLNQTVVDIEFLLISVVQGFALSALASSAVTIVANFQWQYLLYVISAFLLILIFWSQAIMHVLGFIRWPLDMTHNFLYFLAGLVEVMAFSQMNNPVMWFGLITLFVVVSALLYLYDLRMIKDCKNDMQKSPSGRALYKDLYDEQVYDLKYFVPSGLLFNLAALYLVVSYRHLFLTNKYHVILIALQTVFSIIILTRTLNSFKRRAVLIEKTID